MHTKSYELATGSTIRLLAEDVRRERTGVHAKIVVGCDTTILAWTNFNVERDEDRLRLSNSAHKHLGDLNRACWSANDMKHALDVFAARLWDEQVGSIEVGPMAGCRRDQGPEFYIRPFVIKGGGTIIFAPPGRGKSFSGMLLAVSIDAGCNTLFPVEIECPVLYINLERWKESMADRLARINDCLGLDHQRELAFINQRGKSLFDVLDPARRFITDKGIGCVVVDSLSRAGYGDLNENQPANKIADALNDLIPTWVLLAHTPRSDEGHVYGSQMFDAAMDVGVQIKTETRDEGRTVGIGLTVTKANDAPLSKRPFMYAMEFDQTGLTNVRPSSRGEFLEIEMGSMTRDEKLRAFLLAYGEATAGEIAEATGIARNHISEALGKAQWASRRKQGKAVFWGVSTERVP